MEQHVKIRSEEHTSELQSLRHLVCRLLLEKKQKYSHRLLIRGDEQFVCVYLSPVLRGLRREVLPAQRRADAVFRGLPCFAFFFFKERGVPKSLPFSPPRAFPN